VSVSKKHVLIASYITSALEVQNVKWSVIISDTVQDTDIRSNAGLITNQIFTLLMTFRPFQLLQPFHTQISSNM